MHEKCVKCKKCEVSKCNFLHLDSCVYDEIMQPILYSGYLYKSGSLNKGTLSRRTRDGRRLCDKNKPWQRFRSRIYLCSISKAAQYIKMCRNVNSLCIVKVHKIIKNHYKSYDTLRN